MQKGEVHVGLLVNYSLSPNPTAPVNPINLYTIKVVD